MKKLAVGMLALGVLAGGVKAWADGSFVTAPGPVVAATGQNYYYPAAPAPTPGAMLVQDGSLTFRYSNATVSSTNSLTVLQFPAFPSLTLTQLQGASGLTSGTTGQTVFCSNCGANGGKGTLCTSTGTANTFQWVLSTGTACQ